MTRRTRCRPIVFIVIPIQVVLGKIANSSRGGVLPSGVLVHGLTILATRRSISQPAAVAGKTHSTHAESSPSSSTMSSPSPPPSPSSFIWSIECAAALARSSSVRASSSSTWAISLIRSMSASFRGCFDGWRAETPRLTLTQRAQVSQLDQTRKGQYAHHAMLEIKSPILQNPREARASKKKGSRYGSRADREPKQGFAHKCINPGWTFQFLQIIQSQ